MITINLLPWRAYRRAKKIRQKKYAAIVVLCIATSMMVYHTGIFTKKIVRPVLRPILTMGRAQRIGEMTLANISVHQIKFVGFLKHQKNFIGFLKLPNGKINLAKINAIIGREKARIVSIDRQGMLLALAGQMITITEEFSK